MTSLEIDQFVAMAQDGVGRGAQRQRAGIGMFADGVECLGVRGGRLAV